MLLAESESSNYADYAMSSSFRSGSPGSHLGLARHCAVMSRSSVVAVPSSIIADYLVVVAGRCYILGPARSQ